MNWNFYKLQDLQLRNSNVGLVKIFDINWLRKFISYNGDKPSYNIDTKILSSQYLGYSLLFKVGKQIFNQIKVENCLLSSMLVLQYDLLYYKLKITISFRNVAPMSLANLSLTTNVSYLAPFLETLNFIFNAYLILRLLWLYITRISLTPLPLS